MFALTTTTSFTDPCFCNNAFHAARDLVIKGSGSGGNGVEDTRWEFSKLGDVLRTSGVSGDSVPLEVLNIIPPTLMGNSSTHLSNGST